MKPLITLVLVFVITLIVTALTVGPDVMLSGRVGMAAMLLLTALGHFKFTQGMVMMMPHFIPAKKLMVYLTGVLEIAAAIGLLTPFYHLTGWCLLLFFVLILPTNIYAAMRHVNIEKADYEGSGLRYLWFRIPLQMLFIAWVSYFSIMH